MTTQTIAQDKRWQEILTIWRDNRWLFVVVGVLFGILIAPAIEQITGDLNELIGNLVPEAIGIVFTVLILDKLADNRLKAELKQRLLNEVRSSASGTAVTALDWLRRENWIDEDTFKGKTMINVNWEGAYIGGLNLEGSMLNNANFKNVLNVLIADDIELQPINLANTVMDNANLANAILGNADMKGANLHGASLTNAVLRGSLFINTVLQQANLSHADLSGANLSYAHVQQANLSRADLSGANLSHTHVQQANLSYADLSGANLSYVDGEQTNFCNTNLQNACLLYASFQNANFDEKTILPDAEDVRDENGNYRRDADGNYIFTKYWTPETDMTRYTNPEHPDFWQPDWAKNLNEQNEE